MRDTAADWKRIGQQNPFWGVLSNEKFRGRRLKNDTLEEFYHIGRQDVEFWHHTFHGLWGSEFAPETALDFGCGVGRLTIPMAALAESVVGVDVSPSMLRRARARAKTMRVENARFVSRIPKGQFDWVCSYMVLQHIRPADGLPIIERLAGAVAAGGFISLQVANCLEDGTLTDPDAWPEPRHEEFFCYSYPLNTVLHILTKHEFEGLFLQKTNHGGLMGHMIYGRKGHRFATER